MSRQRTQSSGTKGFSISSDSSDSSSSSGCSSSSSSRASTDSISLPSVPADERPLPGSPQDTFGGHTPVDIASPLSRSSFSPSGRPVSLLTTGTGTASYNPSPQAGPIPLPDLGTPMTASASASGSAAAGGGGRASQLSHHGSFGRAAGRLSYGAAVAAEQQRLRERPMSGQSLQFSTQEGSEFSHSYSQSQRSSWIPTTSPTASNANIAFARKQRISTNPPLPDHPYLPPPPPPLSPRAVAAIMASSNAAAAAAAADASSSNSASQPTLGQPSRTTLTSLTAGGSTGMLPQSALSSPSSSSLQPPSAPYAPQSPSSSMFSRNSRASIARARAREHSTDEPLPSPLGANSFASTTFPSMSPGMTPTDSINRDLPPLPGELPLPHYSFLDEDPTLGGLESPMSVRSGGVSQFSGRRVSAQSVPVSEAPRLKHLSAQSGFSDLLNDSSMRPVSTQGAASNGDNTVAGPSRATSGSRYSRWSLFAGGPPPAWGRRESVRSMRSSSLKSNKSKKRSSKHASMTSSGPHHAAADPEDLDDEEWGKDDDTIDLSILVHRAAILERLLRAGKRASGITTARRVSTVSSSTRYSGITSKQSGSRHGHHAYRSRSSPSPPPGTSTSYSQRLSVQSVTNSLRRHVANKLGLRSARPFEGLGSEDGETTTDEPSSYSQNDFVDLASTDHSSFSSHHFLPPPGTPPRRAVSTSLSRRDRELPRLPGQGAGVIVFPELATMPALQPLNRDGEVCAQSCLPASAAIPYTPLKPPPPTQKMHSSRSLHSLRNLRFVDEKHGYHFGSWSNASAQRHSSSMLIGDVPSCDNRKTTRSARRLKIILIIASIMVVVIIIGLLVGLLVRRERYDR